MPPASWAVPTGSLSACCASGPASSEQMANCGDSKHAGGSLAASLVAGTTASAPRAAAVAMMLFIVVHQRTGAANLAPRHHPAAVTVQQRAPTATLQASALELAARIRAGELTSRQVVDAHIARLEAAQPRTRAIAVPCFDAARAAADEAD